MTISREAGQLSHRYAVENILTSCTTVWYGNCSAVERKALQQVVISAQRITINCLPSATDIYISRCRNIAASILMDPSHPTHGLFNLLPSGGRMCIIIFYISQYLLAPNALSINCLPLLNLYCSTLI